MKAFTQEHTSDDIAPYVNELFLDSEESNLSFRKCSEENFESLYGIFATYRYHNHDGLKPVEYRLEKNQISHTLTLSGNLQGIIQLCRDMGLIDDHTKDAMSKFLIENPTPSKGGSCTFG